MNTYRTAVLAIMIAIANIILAVAAMVRFVLSPQSFGTECAQTVEIDEFIRTEQILYYTVNRFFLRCVFRLRLQKSKGETVLKRAFFSASVDPAIVFNGCSSS